MSLRTAIKKNRIAVTSAAVVLLLVAGLLILRSQKVEPYPLFDDKWMFDLNDQELVRASHATVSPSDLSGGTYDFGEGLGEGGSLVDAVVMSCGDATALEQGMTPEEVQGVGAQIAYLRRESPVADAAESNNDPTLDMGPDDGLVSDLTFSAWTPALTDAGIAIMQAGLINCPDGKLPVNTKPTRSR